MGLMAETHYHPCNLNPCGLDGASDDIELSVWVKASGGVNVATWDDGGDTERAEAYVAEEAAAGRTAWVMMRDVIRTPWRKATP
jgi:hypothetical protein